MAEPYVTSGLFEEPDERSTPYRLGTCRFCGSKFAEYTGAGGIVVLRCESCHADAPPEVLEKWRNPPAKEAPAAPVPVEANAGESETQPGAAATGGRVCRLAIDGDKVLLDGERVPLDLTSEAKLEVLCYLKHLLAAEGDWRTLKELDAMEAASETCTLHVDTRWDRTRKKLPSCLFELTQTNKRKGVRLVPATWHS
jgi:hypothetical protein